ncbi:MAG: Glutaredoxin-like protein, YruB-family [archaeon GW2011_AR11]|nr:MAG: Glutaredoxin-like protein, YruB-family [archaeon GW2011_AR11]
MRMPMEHSTGAQKAHASAEEKSAKAAKVYSTTTCPWCVKVKDFLKEHGVKYTEVNISTDEKAREEMFEKSGQMGVPVTEIGDEIIVGFNREALKKALHIS